MKAKINVITYMLVGVVLLLASGCAVTDVDRSADFSRYKTYAWGKSKVDVKNPLYNSALIEKNIKATVARELAKRGIAKDTRDPDFVISYQTFTEKKEQTMGGPYGMHPYGPFLFHPYGFYGWGFPYYGWNSAPRTTTVTEGTLIIDITDSKTKELVWRGSVKGNIDDISRLQKQVRKGIKAILKKYPVKPDEASPAIGDKEAIS